MKKICSLIIFALCGASLSAATQEGGGDWFYIPEQNIISNEMWTLKVYENNTSKRQLTVGTKDSTSHKNGLTDRGEGVLDLSTKITTLPDADGNSQEWFITHFTKRALSFRSPEVQTITKLVFPTTTQSVNEYLFHYDVEHQPDGSKVYNNSLAEVVLVAPNCGSCGIWAFTRNGKLKKLTLDVPSLTYLGSQAFNCGALNDSSFSDFNLTKLQILGSMAFAWTHAGGKLTLPSLCQAGDKTIHNAYNMKSLEIGTGYKPDENVTLSLSGNALSSNGSLGDLTIGPYARISFANDDAKASAFKSNGSLTNVVFTGPVLENTRDVLDAILVSKKAITATDVKKQVIIYASRKQGWADLVDTSALSTEEENLKPAFISDADYMGVYVTQDGVRKAWLVHKDSPYDYTDIVSVNVFDPRFDDEIIYSSGAPVDGKFEVGSTVTISPRCNSTTFVGWDGLPEDAVVNGDTVSFKVDNRKPVNITLRTAPNWVYYPNDSVISNAAWKIKVSKVDSEHLRIGSGTSWSNGFTEMGEGILDMSGKVFETGSNAEWKITHFAGSCFAIHAGETSIATSPITMFVFPKTTKSIGSGMMYVANGKSLLESVIMDIPEFDGKLGANTFRGCGLVTNLYVNAPLMKIVGSQSFNCAAEALTDLSKWNLESVEQVESQGLAWRHQSTGFLKLSSVTNIGDMGLRQLKDDANTGYLALDLGSKISPAQRKPLVLYKNALSECNGVRELVLGSYTKLITPDNAGNEIGFGAIESLLLLGPPLEDAQTFIDRVLAYKSVPDDGSKLVTIRASKFLTWGKQSFISSLEGDEIEKSKNVELEEGEELLGVYVTANKERKAWFIHKKSPYDPKGTVIILR